MKNIKLSIFFLFLIINFSYSKGWIKTIYNNSENYSYFKIKIISTSKKITTKKGYLKKRNILFFDIKGEYLKFKDSKLNINDDFVSIIRVARYDFNVIRVVIHLKKKVLFKINKSNKNILINFNKKNKKESIYEKNKINNNKITIVLDPGHGGKDSGTLKDSLMEKDIVLKIAKYLKKDLDNDKLNIILTRNSDKYVSLPYRRNVVIKNNADIFISIHVNDSPYNSKANGIEVFFVSEKGAEDRETELLVRRENISDIAAGMFNVMENENPLAFVLVDLNKRSVINQSIQLALNITKALKKAKLNVRNVKSAGFVVLKNLRAPSILIETGFISNKKERKLLKSDKYLKKIASNIVVGINSFIKNTLNKISLKSNEKSNSNKAK